VVDEDSAHQPGGYANKMGAVLPLHASRSQAHKRLVDERCGLECMAAPLAGHIATGQPSQFALDERHQLLQRGIVTISPAWRRPVTSVAFGMGSFYPRDPRFSERFR